MFEKIKNIRLEDSSSWQNKIFLTFDLDWCSDDVLSHTLDILEKYKVKATFFCTHKTNLLDRMRENPLIELAIHPNFNFLLNGDFRYGKNVEEVIEYYLNIIPEAVSVRSHSLSQGTLIVNSFAKFGLKYDCNDLIPYSAGITLSPYLHWEGVVKVPHFWEDDVCCMYNWKWLLKDYLEKTGLKVFDFHPIHIFLNTENLDRYNNARDYFHNAHELKKFVNRDTYATRNFFKDLVKNK